MSVPVKKLRCAVYTRKSEGLEQDYNSLDAQRDAGEAYIKSQQHEGWSLVKTHYDDGGYTGGNLNRPALQQLMQDIKDGLIDVVVVYKVDRLSRSLHDFAKLVEVFDAHNVTFVSVTQSFNTTTSMGRLTLNILLSFAQFEREVTGERIRDKFASSLKKGIWMGGRLVLGYDLSNRKLIINNDEAVHVRFVFEQYLKLDSIHGLLAQMRARNIKCKTWMRPDGTVKTGGFYTTSSIYTMLKNPLYNGKITHKDAVYDGEHKAIIEDDLWQAVQDKLQSRAIKKRGDASVVKPFLLRDKVFDVYHNRLGTSHTVKTINGYPTRIRYYINKAVVAHGYKRGALKSLNATEIELMVDVLLREAMRDHIELYKNWPYIVPAQKDTFISDSVHRVEISSAQIKVQFNTDQIERIITLYQDRLIYFNPSSDKSKTFDRPQPDIDVTHIKDHIQCTMAYRYRNYGGKKIITDQAGRDVSMRAAHKNPTLIDALVSATKYYKDLSDGRFQSIIDLASEYRRDRSYISKILKLHFLAPSIKAMILDGQQPRTMTMQGLFKIAEKQHWKQQETALGL